MGEHGMDDRLKVTARRSLEEGLLQELDGAIPALVEIGISEQKQDFGPPRSARALVEKLRPDRLRAPPLARRAVCPRGGHCPSVEVFARFSRRQPERVIRELRDH